MASDKINQLIEHFVEDLQRLLAEETRDALFAALSGGQPVTKTRSGRQTAPRGQGRKAAVAAPARGKKGKRVRRSAEDLEAIQEKILGVLRKQPGPTSEQLQEALRLSKKEIQRPLALLRDNEQVRTEGEKRAMRYYVKGRG